MVGPMARPGTRGLGPGLGLKYEIVLRAGPGLDTIVAGRAGPGPHDSICGPGPGQVCTTAADPGRAWASNHVCGPGLGLDFRPVQGPNRYTAVYDLYVWSFSPSAISGHTNNCTCCVILYCTVSLNCAMQTSEGDAKEKHVHVG